MGRHASNISISMTDFDTCTLDFYVVSKVNDNTIKKILVSRIHLSPAMLNKMAGLINNFTEKIQNKLKTQLPPGRPE